MTWKWKSPKMYCIEQWLIVAFAVFLAVVIGGIVCANHANASTTRRAGMTIYADGKAPTPNKAAVMSGQTAGFPIFCEETIAMALNEAYVWRPYFYPAGVLSNFRAMMVRVDACHRTPAEATFFIRRYPCPSPADSCYVYIATSADSLDSGITYDGVVDSLVIRCKAAGSVRIKAH